MATELRAEAVSPEIVFKIIEDIFISSPAPFVLQEAVIRGILSAKTKTVISIICIESDCLPHY